MTMIKEVHTDKLVIQFQLIHNKMDRMCLDIQEIHKVQKDNLWELDLQPEHPTWTWETDHLNNHSTQETTKEQALSSKDNTNMTKITNRTYQLQVVPVDKIMMKERIQESHWEL